MTTQRAIRLGAVAAAATLAATGANAEIIVEADGRCFDKGILEYVECPREPIVVVAPTIIEPAFSWTGGYVGLHGGYAFGDFDGLHDGDEGANTTDQLDFELDADGFLVGGQLGYLLQLQNRIVIGAELSGSYLWADDSVSNIDAERAEGEVNWTAEARARLGYAFDRVLPYATGGIALVDYEGSIDENETPAADEVDHINFDETVFGAVVGAGVEVAVTDSISFRAEGLYYFVEDTTTGYQEAGGSPQLKDGDLGDFFEFEDLMTFRAGLNLRF